MLMRERGLSVSRTQYYRAVAEFTQQTKKAYEEDAQSLEAYLEQMKEKALGERRLGPIDV
jgi:transposase-like protein